jgi:hypothetical protein
MSAVREGRATSIDKPAVPPNSGGTVVRTRMATPTIAGRGADARPAAKAAQSAPAPSDGSVASFVPRAPKSKASPWFSNASSVMATSSIAALRRHPHACAASSAPQC